MRALSSSRTRGFTLVEVVIVLLLLAIMAAMAAPPLAGSVRRAKLNGAMNQLRNDLYYARALAVRAGARVEIWFDPADRGACLGHYELRVRTEPERIAKRVNLATEAPGVCLSQNGNNPLVFTSRGLPHGVAARAFVGSADGMVDTLRFSQAGRAYRRY